MRDSEFQLRYAKAIKLLTYLEAEVVDPDEPGDEIAFNDLRAELSAIASEHGFVIEQIRAFHEHEIEKLNADHERELAGQHNELSRKLEQEQAKNERLMQRASARSGQPTTRLDAVFRHPDGRRLIERAHASNPRMTEMELHYMGASDIAGELSVQAGVRRTG